MIVQGLFLYLWGGGETLSCLPPPQALLLNNLVRIFKRLEKKFVYSLDILQILLHLYLSMQIVLLSVLNIQIMQQQVHEDDLPF